MAAKIQQTQPNTEVFYYDVCTSECGHSLYSETQNLWVIEPSLLEPLITYDILFLLELCQL